jgi:hypothetical protein
VDLESNRRRCARAWWTAPCTRSTGPRWAAHSKRRGMRSEPPAQDLTALDARVQDAAASTQKCGGARRDLAGISPGRRSRPLTRPQDSTKCRGDACTRVRGVKGGDCASPAAGAGRGRSGRSGELVSAPKCARRRETGRGLMLTVRKRRRRAQKRRGCDGGGAGQRRWVGRRSSVVEARLPRALGTRTCSNPSLMSPW